MMIPSTNNGATEKYHHHHHPPPTDDSHYLTSISCKQQTKENQSIDKQAESQSSSRSQNQQSLPLHRRSYRCKTIQEIEQEYERIINDSYDSSSV
jgi:hypothetical protein